MAVPTPPTAGEPIAEAWGDVVHDAVVAQDIQAGSASAPATGSGVDNSTVAVVFARPFASQPIVVAVSNTQHFVVTVRDVTATGMNLVNANRSIGAGSLGARPMTWIAYGPRA